MCAEQVKVLFRNLYRIINVKVDRLMLPKSYSILSFRNTLLLLENFRVFDTISFFTFHRSFVDATDVSDVLWRGNVSRDIKKSFQIKRKTSNFQQPLIFTVSKLNIIWHLHIFRTDTVRKYEKLSPRHWLTYVRMSVTIFLYEFAYNKGRILAAEVS